MGAPLRVVFAGTPPFAAQSLAALLHAGFEVPCVLTQPDRPAGRGMKLQESAVKQLALAQGLSVAQPHGLRLDGRQAQDAHAAQQLLQAVQPDVMVVAAYGLLLPAWVLTLPRLGCLNVHASLLPRWRGAAPIHRAIEAGDHETGITIMQMDAGLDTGAILLRASLPIGPEDTTGALQERLAELGGRLVVEALLLAARGALTAVPQPVEGVSYAHKIGKAEAAIDWTQAAQDIERRVRAFDPYPGMVTYHGPDMLKVWAARSQSGPSAQAAPPGTLLQVSREGVLVATGCGGLLLTELQRAGGKRLPAAEFLAGQDWSVGMRFACAQ